MKSIRCTASVAAVMALAGCGPGGSSGPHGIAPVSSGLAASFPMASSLEARDGAACALVGTGTVLVAGGRTPKSDATDTAELIEANGAVRPVLARMAVKRAGAAAVRLDRERTLVVGGHDERGRALATTEVYSRTAHAFFPGPKLVAPRDRVAIALVGSLVVIAGGGTTSVETIDAATLAARKLEGAFQHPHAGAEIAASGRKIFVGGGDDPDSPESFDLDARSSQVLGFPDQARGQAVFELGGKVVFVGGASNTSPFVAMTKKLDATLHSTIPLGRARVHGTAVPFAGGVLVLGGDDRRAPFAETDEIVSETSWTKGPSLLSARAGLSAVALEDGRVVVTGGRLPSGIPCGDNEMLVPTGGARPDPSAEFDELEGDETRIAQQAFEINSLQAKLAQANDTIDRLTKELAHTTAQRDQAILDKIAAEARLATATATLQLLGTQNADLAARLATAQADLANANAQIAQLQAQVNTLTSQLIALNKSYNDATAALLHVQQQLTLVTGIPMPGIVPGPPPVPVPAAPSGPPPSLTPSANPDRPVIALLDPTQGSPGQPVRIWLPKHGTTNRVFFSGTAAPITSQGNAYYAGVLTLYVVVDVPSIPPGAVAVQVAGDGLISDPAYFRIR